MGCDIHMVAELRDKSGVWRVHPTQGLSGVEMHAARNYDLFAILIYCHADGCVEGVGRKLFDYYTEQEKVDSLVELGPLSELGCDIGVKHPFDAPPAGTPEHTAYKLAFGGMCRAYGRDRGEPHMAPEIGETLASLWPVDDQWVEFIYVWDGQKWHLGTPCEGSQTLVELETVFAAWPVFRSIYGV